MSLLQIAEVFGHDTGISVEENIRRNPQCPFRNNVCTKQNKHDPLGICSYSEGSQATVVCPVRFRESERLFIDAGRAAFGSGNRIMIVPEVRLLEVPGTKKRIGKIDYVIAKLSDSGDPVDFAAVEVQAVYVSGKSSRAPFEHYLRTGSNHTNGRRRPDFRSSAQKRLMPQLSLKVPVFRRWGKKFFVAVDETFFNELPTLRPVQRGNAEITWLVYPFRRTGSGYRMGEPEVVYTLWDDVLASLREGTPPTQEELLSDLRRAPKLHNILEI